MLIFYFNINKNATEKCSLLTCIYMMISTIYISRLGYFVIF